MLHSVWLWWCSGVPAPFPYRTGQGSLGRRPVFVLLLWATDPPHRFSETHQEAVYLRRSVCGEPEHLCLSQSFTLTRRGVQVVETEGNRFEEVDLDGFNTPSLSRTTTKGVERREFRCVNRHRPSRRSLARSPRRQERKHAGKHKELSLSLENVGFAGLVLKWCSCKTKRCVRLHAFLDALTAVSVTHWLARGKFDASNTNATGLLRCVVLLLCFVLL